MCLISFENVLRTQHLSRSRNAFIYLVVIIWITLNLVSKLTAYSNGYFSLLLLYTYSKLTHLQLLHSGIRMNGCFFRSDQAHLQACLAVRVSVFSRACGRIQACYGVCLVVLVGVFRCAYVGVLRVCTAWFICTYGGCSGVRMVVFTDVFSRARGRIQVRGGRVGT